VTLVAGDLVDGVIIVPRAFSELVHRSAQNYGKIGPEVSV